MRLQPTRYISVWWRSNTTPYNQAYNHMNYGLKGVLIRLTSCFSSLVGDQYIDLGHMLCRYRAYQNYCSRGWPYRVWFIQHSLHMPSLLWPCWIRHVQGIPDEADPLSIPYVISTIVFGIKEGVSSFFFKFPRPLDVTQDFLHVAGSLLPCFLVFRLKLKEFRQRRSL